MKQFLFHRNSGRMFEVVSLDKAAGIITLKNEMAEFADTFDQAKFKAIGYFPVKGEDEDEARAAALAKIEAEQEAA